MELRYVEYLSATRFDASLGGGYMTRLELIERIALGFDITSLNRREALSTLNSV